MRLERDIWADKYHLPLFQFHKGAIRTLSLTPLLVKAALFQFHKGAIRTGDGIELQHEAFISIP